MDISNYNELKDEWEELSDRILDLEESAYSKTTGQFNQERWDLLKPQMAPLQTRKNELAEWIQQANRYKLTCDVAALLPKADLYLHKTHKQAVVIEGVLEEVRDLVRDDGLAWHSSWFMTGTLSLHHNDTVIHVSGGTLSEVIIWCAQAGKVPDGAKEAVEWEHEMSTRALELLP